MRSAGCKCYACPFAKDGKPDRYVLASGSRTAPSGVVVLGDGPTRESVKAGEVLHAGSATGDELNTLMQEAGINREDLLIVPAWACQPQELTKEVEERAAVEACRPLVDWQLKDVPKDTPTLLMGKWATRSVDGREKGLFSNRGFRDDKWKLGDERRKEKDDEHSQG